jgi:hypothetical protein
MGSGETGDSERDESVFDALPEFGSVLEPEPFGRRRRSRRNGMAAGIAAVVGVTVSTVFAYGHWDIDRTDPSSTSGVSGALASASAAVAALESAEASPLVTATLPAAAGGLTRMSAARLSPQAKQALAKASADPQFAGGRAAGYEQTGTATFAASLVLVPMASSGSLTNLYLDAGASKMLSRVVSPSHGYSEIQAGSSEVPDSAAACGFVGISGSKHLRCYWADAVSYGSLTFESSVGVSRGLQDTEALEGAATDFTW